MAKTTIICPDCQNEIPLEEGKKYQVGDVIECPSCGTQLEVVEVLPDGSVKVEVIELEK